MTTKSHAPADSVHSKTEPSRLYLGLKLSYLFVRMKVLSFAVSVLNYLIPDDAPPQMNSVMHGLRQKKLEEQAEVTSLPDNVYQHPLRSEQTGLQPQVGTTNPRP